METEKFAKLTGRPAELAPLPLTGRYPESVLRREAVKGGIGVAICLGIVWALEPSPWLAWPLAGVAVLFGLYLLQQVRRFSLRLEVDDTGVTRMTGGNRQAYRWSELRNFRLNYYPNGRKAAMGTLVIVLQGKPGKLKVDSTLDHFPSLLSRAAQAARELQLELHPSTQANLEQLGL